MLRIENKNRLIEKGLTLQPLGKEIILILKTDPSGNSIPNKRFGPLTEMDLQGNIVKETFSNCPMMGLSYKENLFHLSCWSWAPGPGPGDFRLEFNDEDSLVEFIESYYFGKNKYFSERLEYELKKQ